MATKTSSEISLEETTCMALGWIAALVFWKKWSVELELGQWFWSILWRVLGEMIWEWGIGMPRGGVGLGGSTGILSLECVGVGCGYACG